jgi:hypothetical protein
MDCIFQPQSIWNPEIFEEKHIKNATSYYNYLRVKLKILMLPQRDCVCFSTWQHIVREAITNDSIRFDM